MQCEASSETGRKLVDRLNDLVLLMDPQHTILDVNQAAVQALGVPRHRILGNRCYEVIHGTAGPPSGCPQVGLTRQVGESPSFRFQETINERTICLVCSGLGDEMRGMEGIIAVGRDVTDIKLAQEALKNTEQKLRLIVDNLPIGLMIVQQGRVIFGNPIAWQFLGAQREEVAFVHFLDFVHPDDREMMEDWHRLVSSSQKAHPATYRMVDVNGRSRWVEAQGIKVMWDARDAFLLFLKDTGGNETVDEERARLEDELRQVRKVRGIVALAAGLAHDLKNVLGIISGHAELALARAQKGDPSEYHLSQIMEATHRSEKLMRHLVSFAREEIRSPQVLNLNGEIERILPMLTGLLREEIHVIWLPGRDLWDVYVDSSDIERIIINLVLNSKDAIPGKGTIIIETQNFESKESQGEGGRDLPQGQYVMLSIGDSGCGMNSKTMARLFQPFFSTKEQEGGSGLGLSTVRQLVKVNRGTIRVYSQKGIGTRFEIYFPRYSLSEEQPPTCEIPQARNLESLKGSETVLLVEDQKPLLQVYAKFLEILGYRVLQAQDPAEAMAVAGAYTGPIHLLLADVVMPQMSGLELWEKLHATRAEMKCLLISGYPPNVIFGKWPLERRLPLIAKPFTIEVLGAKLKELLKEDLLLEK
jgi:PAS domain S-box-containing protein